MAFYSAENWTIKQVANAFKSKNDSERMVVIPIFQRGLRWEAKRRSEFIDSLKKGYPFGSLLFARHDNNPNKYSVVDGLQRGSTVCDYVFNPLCRNNISDIDETVLTKIRKTIFPDNENSSINKNISSIILDYFDEKKTFSNMDNFELAARIYDSIPSNQDFRNCTQKIINHLKEFLQDLQKEYDSICDAVVPIIVYSGPQELLNDIFNRINVKGIPLNKYEIYAATWSQERKLIDDASIITYVVNKYMALQEQDYVVECFDANEFYRKKELTAFEYLFGLGKYWKNKYDCLKFDNKIRPDEVDELAFEKGSYVNGKA